MKVNGPIAGVILWNESDFVDAILENENGSCVGVILENESDSCDVRILRNSLDVGVSYIDWIPHHNSPPHYHPSFLGYVGPFSGAYLLPQTLNFSSIYAIAPPPGLFPRTIHALWHLIPFGMSDMTPLRDQIVPPIACAPCLHIFFAFVFATWILEKTQRIRSRRGLPNILQTFSLCVSPC